MAALVLVGAAAAANGTEFNARGNEPGWSIHKTDAGITFRTMDGKTVTISPLPAVQGEGDREVYRSMAGDQTFALMMTRKVCTDTMSGMPFPVSVTVEVGAQKFMGCGGEPGSLLRGDWVVGTIDGKPIIKETQVTLNFGADKQVSGGGSCNRYFGSYSLTGEGLTISQLGSSMMMCDQPIIDQEALFLRILEGVMRLEIEPNGALILRARDGRSIVASRKG